MEKLYLKRSWRIGTCLMVLLTFFAFSLSAQNRKVTGVVVDEFGDPLPGANITVVGNQSLATATNMEGLEQCAERCYSECKIHRLCRADRQTGYLEKQ